MMPILAVRVVCALVLTALDWSDLLDWQRLLASCVLTAMAISVLLLKKKKTLDNKDAILLLTLDSSLAFCGLALYVIPLTVFLLFFRDNNALPSRLMAIPIVSSALAFWILYPQPETQDPARVLLSVLRDSRALNFYAALTAMYCAARITDSGSRRRLITAQGGAAVILIALNGLTNIVKYKSELPVESNMHHYSLATALIFALCLVRIKRPLVFFVVHALSTFFLTVAAAYSYVNGYQLVYFLYFLYLLSSAPGKTTLRLCMIISIASLLITAQINPHAIFADTTGDAHVLALHNFTWAQVAGLVLAIATLAFCRARLFHKA